MMKKIDDVDTKIENYDDFFHSPSTFSTFYKRNLALFFNISVHRW